MNDTSAICKPTDKLTIDNENKFGKCELTSDRIMDQKRRRRMQCVKEMKRKRRRREEKKYRKINRKIHLPCFQIAEFFGDHFA